MDDLISRQEALTALSHMMDTDGFRDGWVVSRANVECMLKALPSAEPEPKEIGYTDCADAMMKMWIDNVLTDGEYSRIMDKLNAHWAERREDE